MPLFNDACLAGDPSEQTIDPLPTSATLLVQPQYGFPHGQTRFQSQVLVQPTLPFSSFFIPGLLWGAFRSVVRVQITIESIQLGDRYAGGLADLQFVDVAVHSLGPFDVGAGVSTVYPMATDPLLGAGQWQLGPVMAATLHSIRHLLIGAAVEVLWSVAWGSQRPSLGYVNVQPIALVNLPTSLSIFSNAQ